MEEISAFPIGITPTQRHTAHLHSCAIASLGTHYAVAHSIELTVKAHGAAALAISAVSIAMAAMRGANFMWNPYCGMYLVNLYPKTATRKQV